MSIFIAMFFLFIFRKLDFEFIYVAILTYIFHYIAYATVFILCNAKKAEYDVESDIFRIKNGLTILTLGILLVRYINSPSTFHWYFIIIPIISDLISVLILKRWYINWKDTIIYSILLSAKTNGYAIICAFAFMYVDSVGVPVAILILFIIGFVMSIIHKISK